MEVEGMVAPSVRTTASGLVREMNDRIRELSRNLEVPEACVTRYLCECGDPACLETVELTFEEYGQVRDDTRLTLVASGHERTGDDVLRRSGSFANAAVDGRNGAPSPDNLEAVLEDLRVRVNAIRAEVDQQAGSPRRRPNKDQRPQS